MSKSPPEEKFALQAQAGKEVIKQISEHALELNSLLTKSGEKYHNSLQKHLKSSTDEALTAVKKPTK